MERVTTMSGGSQDGLNGVEKCRTATEVLNSVKLVTLHKVDEFYIENPKKDRSHNIRRVIYIMGIP